jgi:hypothetical protein
MTKTPDHKLLYGALTVGYVVLFTLTALVEIVWPSGNRSDDCQDQWKDTIG